MRPNTAAVGSQTLWSNTLLAYCSLPAAWQRMGTSANSSFLITHHRSLARQARIHIFSVAYVAFNFMVAQQGQKAHLRRITGNGIRPCSEVEEKAPELVAELEREMQQEQRQKELQQKRAASSSSASASKPSKQQKLESGFARQSKALVDAEVAAFFYAEGIPFAKVGRR